MGVIIWLRFGITSEFKCPPIPRNKFNNPFKFESGLYITKPLPSNPFFSSPETKEYTPTKLLEGHTDWVRDVAWSPSILTKSYIASASQDNTVRIWTNADPTGQPDNWKCHELQFNCVLWRVSWSMSGNILAVSGGDNHVSLWKENLRGDWEKVKDIEE